MEAVEVSVLGILKMNSAEVEVAVGSAIMPDQFRLPNSQTGCLQM